MKIEYLKTVLTVAKLKNFNQAAFELYCSQSSVSRHVNTVESELHTTLFQRSSNSNVVQLTRQGELLLPQIESVLNSYNTLEEMANIPERKSKTLLRLGISESIFSADTKSTMTSKFYLAYPEIVLYVEDIKKIQFLEYLILNKLDAVVFYQSYWNDQSPSPPNFGESIMCIPIAKVPLRIGMGEKHPLAASKAISVWMLANERFIFDTDSIKMSEVTPLNQHGMFMKMCRDNGFVPELLQIDRDLANIKLFMTAQGEGVHPSFMPISLCSYRGISNVLVSDAPYYSQYYLLAVSGRKKSAVEKLAAFLQQTFQTE